MMTLMQRPLRIAAWLCVALLAYLSLIPAEFEIRTGAPGGFEHMVAYCGTALLFGLGYPGSSRRIAFGLICYGGIMEALQSIPPDRHPSIYDALSSGTGAVLGTLIAMLLAKRARHGLTMSGRLE